MNVVVEFSVIPIGVGVSISNYIAECERVLMESGLSPQLHANGTNVEGEWDIVMGAIKRCHTRLHEMGAPRISTTIKVSTRTDINETLQSKVDSVQRRLA